MQFTICGFTQVIKGVPDVIQEVFLYESEPRSNFFTLIE
jgi:hypothetical protein